MDDDDREREHPPEPRRADHAHGHLDDTALVDGGRQHLAVRIILGIVAAVAVTTIAGLIVWWPRGDAPDTGASIAGLAYPRATVVDIDHGECPTFEFDAPSDCDLVSAELTSGPDEGSIITFQVAAIDFDVPTLSVGDRLVLQHNPLAPPEFAYTYWEHQRDTPLIALTALFVIVILIFGRWHGARALVGLVVTFGIIVWFLLPSLLRDEPAVAVALVATSLIAFATLYLAHGVSLNTTVALVGTMASLVVIATLAAVFVGLAHLTGLSSADVQLIRVSAEALDPAGLLLAGIIIGALGVLDDVTVTQVAAVAEIRAADPTMSPRRLYQGGLRVGRDHIAATVNTLVLAYVGASLSLMLFFAQSDRPIGQLLGQEAVAIEIVRTLVGSIGLVAAVPITTALAVLVSTAGRPPAGHPPDPEPADATPSWEDFAPDDEPRF
ncbi:MAG: YibE/F family protein [Acidimicrobiales bacterium]|nr:YibE/F family protein [Acidimicrobiales bacterium]